MTPLEVLVAGGGVAGLETLLALRALAGDRVRTTLLDPGDAFALRAMTVAEPFAAGHAIRVPLGRIAADAGARHVRDALATVMPDRHRVRTAKGETLHFDALVLALGAENVPPSPHALTFDPDDTVRLHGLLRDVDEGYARRLAVVIPDAAHWPLPGYELALLLAREAHGMGLDDFRITLVTPERAPLIAFGAAASAAVRDALSDRGVALEVAARPQIGRGTVALGDGRTLEVDRILALPRLVPRGAGGVPVGPGGFLVTDAHGRVHGVDDVYAAGDGTAFPIKQGTLAAQQADAVAEHLAARAGAAIEPAPFTPVLRGRLLTGGSAPLDLPTGEDVAAAPLWWPPAKVAGRHLAPYLAAREAAVARALEAPADGVEVAVTLPT